MLNLKEPDLPETPSDFTSNSTDTTGKEYPAVSRWVLL